MNYLNGTGYDSSQPWGENWADWSSASWGNGWAGTPGGVARQLGLKGRELGEFARAVNNQKRRLAEVASGDNHGYKPDLAMPASIAQLYQSKGASAGNVNASTAQPSLESLMIQQQQEQQRAYEAQMAEARRQQEALAAQAAEAQRQALAAQNAYVPGLEPTAGANNPGGPGQATRKAANNTLSNLAIITGMGLSGGVTATPAGSALAPLAGLQIA